jgi:hypothetical protein
MSNHTTPLTVWIVTVIDDESPIVSVYSSEAKALDAADRAYSAADEGDQIHVVVNEQPVL